MESSGNADEDPRIVIVGAGEMGRGIAQKFAMQGMAIDLVDQTTDILEHSLGQIRENLKVLVEANYLSAAQAEQVLPRIRTFPDLEPARDAEFVLESIPENLQLKLALFERLDEICSEATILATNTSSLSISKIASATHRADRVLGCHWVSPPYLIPLVEVIRGNDTSDRTLDYCLGLMHRVGVVPAVCRKDIPGFIINRMQRVMQNEALDLVERGVASLEDVDNIVWLALGARLALNGPLKVNDLTVDKAVSLHGCEYMFREIGDPRFKPSALMREKVAQGALGIRTGQGWYDYSGKTFEQLKKERDLAYAKLISFMRREGYYPK